MSNEMKDWFEEQEKEDAELFSNIMCALTHDMKTCETCRKCKGENFADIRINLVKQLAERMNRELPWEEDEK